MAEENKSAPGKNQSVFKLVAVIAVVAVVALLALFGFRGESTTTKTEDVGQTQTEETHEQESEITFSQDGKTVTYQGEEGHTALELLKELTQVDTKDTSFGEQVIAINGVEQSGDSYWLYYVNGEPAQVGAADYQTKPGDTIEWRLE